MERGFRGRHNIYGRRPVDKRAERAHFSQAAARAQLLQQRRMHVPHGSGLNGHKNAGRANAQTDMQGEPHIQPQCFSSSPHNLSASIIASSHQRCGGHRRQWFCDIGEGIWEILPEGWTPLSAARVVPHEGLMFVPLNDVAPHVLPRQAYGYRFEPLWSHWNGSDEIEDSGIFFAKVVPGTAGVPGLGVGPFQSILGLVPTRFSSQ